MIELNSSAYSTATAGLAAPPERRRHWSQVGSAQPASAGNELRLRHPFSLPFLGFAVALVGTAAATYLQPGATSAVTSNDLTLISRLGTIGSTVFALAACAILYRAVTTRSLAMVPIAMLLIGPGAWWNWGLFSDGQPSPAALSQSVTLLVIISAVAIAGCLLLEASRNARWLGVYCGLGSIGLAVGALLVRSNEAAAQTVSLAMMMVLAGLACLYGTLVEIEAVRRQSLEELLSAKEKTETEIARTEGVLHDLRSGLLSIEAAIGSFDSDMVGPLRNEAARLRQLTVRSKRGAVNFDLVPGLRDLALARRPSGLMVDVRVPASAIVRGEESELLSVVDNLLSNAHRHGRSPIRLEVGEQDSWIWVAVTDGGPRSAGPHSESGSAMQSGRIFRRGHTTHPDGEGIGLHRAQALAEKNHGRLILDSDYHDGTRFVLALPSMTPIFDRPADHSPHYASVGIIDQSPVSDPHSEPVEASEPNFDYLHDHVEPQVEMIGRSGDEQVSSVHFEPAPPAPVDQPAEQVVHFDAPPSSPILEADTASNHETMDEQMAQAEETVSPGLLARFAPPEAPGTPIDAVVASNSTPLSDDLPRTPQPHPSVPTSPPPIPEAAPVAPSATEPEAREPWVWPEPTTPPLPPASMALREPEPAESLAESDTVALSPAEDEIRLDDGTVIDLARSTDQISFELPRRSELPTGPVPIQISGHPPVDISGPIDLTAEQPAVEAS